MKNIMTLSLIGLLLSCASNSGVFRVGQNTYQVTTRATWELGGRVGAMQMAMQEATKFCSEHGGKQLKVVKETDDYGHFQGGIVNLTFSCECSHSEATIKMLGMTLDTAADIVGIY